MFQDAVDALRVFVGCHSGTAGCSAATLIEAAQSVLLPSIQLAPNPTLCATLLQLLSAGHSETIRVLRMEETQRDASFWSEVTENWSNEVLEDKGLAERTYLFPSRELRREALGVDADYPLTESTWAVLEVLGNHLVEGVPASVLRDIGKQGSTPSAMYNSLTSLAVNGLIVTAAVITGDNELAEHYFLSIARPAVHTRLAEAMRLPTASRVLLAYLAEKRAAVRASYRQQPSQTASKNDDDDSDGAAIAELYLSQRTRRVVSYTFEAESTGSGAASACPGSPESAIAVEEAVVAWIMNHRFAGQVASVRQLTRAICKFYHVPFRRGFFSTVINTCVASNSTLKWNKRTGSVRLLSSCSDVTHLRAQRDGCVPQFCPLFPFAREVVRRASHTPVTLEHVHPDVLKNCGLTKTFAATIRAIATSDEFRNSVGVSSVRCQESKSFTLLLKPGGGAAVRGRGAVQGVSEWCRTYLMSALQTAPRGLIVMEALQESSLDKRTLQRSVVLLRDEGLIVTSGIQLPGRRRLGLIIDAKTVADVRECDKEHAAEKFFSDELAKRMQRREEKQALQDEERAEKRSRVDAADDKSSAQSGQDHPAVNALRSRVVMLLNGAASSLDARCWRLHLQLWEIVMRLNASRCTASASSSELPTVAIGQLLSEMSFSTFCVVVGLQLDDADRLWQSTVGRVGVALPWGCPMRLLPSELRRLCDEHPRTHLFAALFRLQQLHLVETNIPSQALDGGPVNLTWRVALQETATAPDGTIWTFCQQRTALLSTIGLFWVLGVVTAPLTPLRKLSSSRMRALEKVCALEGPLSLAEVYALSKAFHVEAGSVAVWSYRAAGDVTQLPPSLGASNRTLSYRTRDNAVATKRVHPAIQILLTQRRSRAVVGDQEDGGATCLQRTNEEIDHTTLHSSITTALLDDAAYLRVLRHMKRTISSQSTSESAPVQLLVNLLDLLQLQVAQWAPQPVPRHARLALFRSCWNPSGADTGALPPQVAASELLEVSRGICTSKTPSLSALQSAIVCTLLSEESHCPLDRKHALLDAYSDAEVASACRQLPEQFPSSFAGKSTSGMVSRVAFKTGRCRVSSYHNFFPKAFGCDALMCNIAVRHADSLFKGAATRIGGGCVELLRQPVLSLDAAQDGAGDAADGLRPAVLEYPEEWVRTAKAHRSMVADSPAVDPSSPGYTPVMTAWRQKGNALWLAPEYDTLRDVVRCYPPPASAAQSALCNADGTFNPHVCAAAVAKVRSVLLLQPGTEQDDLLRGMARDGFLGVDACRWLCEHLVSGGYITAKRFARTPQVPFGSSRYVAPQEASECRWGCSMWWNMRRSGTVWQHPLEIFAGVARKTQGVAGDGIEEPLVC